jgi:hypothetical protein
MKVDELVRNLRHVEQGYAEKHYGVGEVRVCDMAKDCADAIEALTAELELYKTALKEANKPNDEAIRIIQEQGTRITARDNVIADLRNELCLKCGKYKTAHEGSCEGCRWKLKGA